MKVTPLEWDEKLVIKFWDYYSQFPEKYFTYQFGGNIVSILSRNVKPGSSILDYGCGTGFLIKHFVDKGFETYGADTSPVSVESVNNRYRDFPNYKGSFLIDELLKLNRKFDVIFVIEVIEHLTDEFLFPLIGNVKKLVNPGGQIIFTTPKDEDLDNSTVYCPVCDHTFHRWQHVRRWSIDSLKSCLQKQNLHVTSCYGTDFSENKPKEFLKKIKHSARNYFFSTPNPHLVAICQLP